jgi:hypothetical protein
LAATPGAGFSETPDFLKIFQSETLQPTWYEQKLWRMYDCPDWVRNLRMLPTIAYSGALDKQKQAADVMASASWGLPERERFELTHLVAPNTAHQVAPESRREIERRLKILDSARSRERPQKLSFTTYTLRYPRAHWLTVDALQEHWEPGTLRAMLQWEDRRVYVQVVSGVRQFTLELDASEIPKDASRLEVLIEDTDAAGQPRQVWLRGENAIPKRSDRSWKGTFRLDDTGWHLVPPLAPEEPGLRKHHGLQGPIDDAFLSSFLFVRPTGPGMHSQTDAWVQSEFEHAVRAWQVQMRGEVRIKTSDEVTPEDLRKHNLVLWGDPQSNPTLSKILDALPFGWSSESITLGDRTFDSKTHMPLMIYPNPLAPDRYVVLNSGFTYREYDYLNNARQVPKLPDWAIVDTTTPPGPRWPGLVVDAAFFDERWRFKLP